MTSVDELVAETKRAFAFLEDHGFALDQERQHSPESFKGGFELVYRSPVASLRIAYSDMELLIERDRAELFGPTIHGSFAGNMFSRDNLHRCLKRIAGEISRASKLCAGQDA